jgi:hypothetical protein
MNEPSRGNGVEMGIGPFKAIASGPGVIPLLLNILVAGVMLYGFYVLQANLWDEARRLHEKVDQVSMLFQSRNLQDLHQLQAEHKEIETLLRLMQNDMTRNPKSDGR